MKNKILGYIFIVLDVGVLIYSLYYTFNQIKLKEYSTAIQYISSSVIPLFILLYQLLCRYSQDFYLSISKIKLNKTEFYARIDAEYSINKNFNIKEFKKELQNKLEEHNNNNNKSNNTLIKTEKFILEGNQITLKVEIDEQLFNNIIIRYDGETLTSCFDVTKGKIKEIKKILYKLNPLIDIIEKLVENTIKYNLNITFANKENPYLHYIINNKKLDFKGLSSLSLKFSDNIYLYKNKLEIFNQNFNRIIYDMEEKLIKLELN